ncbi:MAG: branched-chain amino acid ABC transporter permease [Halovenus sp.]
MADDHSLFTKLRRALTLDGLKRTPIRFYIAVVFFLYLALGPYAGQMDVLGMLQWTAAFFFVMFVISWDFVAGYTGQVSFGHTLFFAAGGYTTTILNLEFGLDPILGVLAGILVASVAGLFYAIPSLRLEGHYLALFTLLPPIILLRVFRMFRDITGGEKGLPDPDPLIDAGSFAGNARVNFYLALGLLVFVFGLTWIITRSDTGTIFTAIDESEDAVQSAGINPAKFKVYAMTLSAALGGLAGAVFVHTPAGSASPSQLLELTVMIEILLASIVGGFGTITGAVVGGFLIYWGTDWFRTAEYVLPGLDIPISQIDLLLFFTVLLLVLYFLAEGIVPWSYRQGGRIMDRVRGGDSSAMTDGGRSGLRQRAADGESRHTERPEEDDTDTADRRNQ